jgi:hypothetical protein
MSARDERAGLLVAVLQFFICGDQGAWPDRRDHIGPVSDRYNNRV